MNQKQVRPNITEFLEGFVIKAQENHKADTPQIVIREVLSWTKGQLDLTKKLCYIILSGAEIPNDEEKTRIKQLVQKHFIENWETQDNAKHLQQMCERIVQHQECFWLLVQYQQVLQKQKLAEDSPEVQELLKLNLVVKQNGGLQVHNPIYEAVFTRDWVKQKLFDLFPYPYVNKLVAWQLSNCQDESQLLRGQELQKALESTKGRTLNQRENRFLIHSQVFNLRGD